MSAPKSAEPQNAISTKSFNLKCPSCKASVTVTMPLSIKDMGQGGLTNILIPHTATPCGHAMQIFLDLNYRVRGYTRIDYVNEESASEAEMKKASPVHVTSSSFFKGRPLDEREEAGLSSTEKALKDNLQDIIRKFAAGTPHVKAVACFDYEGFIIAKALAEEVMLEDVSLLAGSMMTQSSVIGKSLKISSLTDFTITSEVAKITVKKAGEVLILVYYGKDVKEGLMKFNLNKLADDIKAIADKFS
jgi:predicted regulator of Ras-like GTPase activity (Roadblock/LC7/MglB family)